MTDVPPPQPEPIVITQEAAQPATLPNSGLDASALRESLKDIIGNPEMHTGIIPVVIYDHNNSASAPAVSGNFEKSSQPEAPEATTLTTSSQFNLNAPSMTYDAQPLTYTPTKIYSGDELPIANADASINDIMAQNGVATIAFQDNIDLQISGVEMQITPAERQGEYTATITNVTGNDQDIQKILARFGFDRNEPAINQQENFFDHRLKPEIEGSVQSSNGFGVFTGGLEENTETFKALEQPPQNNDLSASTTIDTTSPTVLKI